MEKRRRSTKDTSGQPEIAGEGLLALTNMNNLGKLEIPTSGVTSEVVLMVFHMVHDLIEQCMQSYMTKKQTAETLQRCNNIPSAITLEMWRSLEKENPEFFRAYNARVILMHQIVQFNTLLEKMDKLRGAQARQNEAPDMNLIQPVRDNSAGNGSSGVTEEGNAGSGSNGSAPHSDDDNMLIDSSYDDNILAGLIIE